MIIKIIHSMTEVDANRWNNLHQDKSPFLRHEFLLALEQSGSVCAETGWQAHHLLVFDEDTLIAAMPLYLKSHSWGEYVFDQQWADAQSGMDYYPKWVNTIPFTPCSGQRILIQDNVDTALIIQRCIKTIKNISEHNNISSFHCLFPNTQQTNVLKKHLLLREGVQFQWFNKGYKDFDDYDVSTLLWTQN
jgi:predicted N-acyltransferase